LETLAGAALVCPTLDAGLLGTYLSDYIGSGLFDASPRCG